jgi:hypothetical protein
MYSLYIHTDDVERTLGRVTRFLTWQGDLEGDDVDQSVVSTWRGGGDISLEVDPLQGATWHPFAV